MYPRHVRGGADSGKIPQYHRLQGNAGVDHLVCDIQIDRIMEHTYTTDEIYQLLETDLVSLRLKPGQLISENTLCQQFHVSRTPIRSVLQRLEQNGFVADHPDFQGCAALCNLQYYRAHRYQRMACTDNLAAAAVGLQPVIGEFMTLKEKMKNGPVFGMACFTGVTCVIENIAMSGLDFIYLDLEHTNWMLGETFEKQIMAAKLHDISVLVRMADDDEVAIRKVLEWGADGVVIPHCKTAGMARKCVEAAKFSPLGRRGGESNVRAAGFGCHNFDWNTYIEQQNRDTLVIPMDEDYEFTDNLEEILAVEGIDAVNFGPIDYAVSKNLEIGYTMGEEVKEAYNKLVTAAKAKGIGVLGPVVPPTKENLENAVKEGYNMIIVGNDMWHFQKALKEVAAETAAVRAG